MVSSHSDDKGLIIPPKLSEHLAVLLSINPNSDAVRQLTFELINKLVPENNIEGDHIPNKNISINSADTSILVDNRDVRIGSKLCDWELSGYPLAIKYGEQEAKASTVILHNRVTGKSVNANIDTIENEVQKILTEIHEELYFRSGERLRNNTIYCDSIKEVEQAISNSKFAVYAWDGNPSFEASI